MRFDKDLLQEIKKQADIVFVISSFINVIKKGRNYVAVCPFHDDHNPSMQISVEHQTYRCFVCGNGGDVFTFVQNYEKISFEQAVKRVAEIINFDDPRLHKKEYIAPINEDISVLYNCINDLLTFYQYGLSTSEGNEALEYLLNRGISKEQIKKYSLGYSLKDGEKTIDYLKSKGYSLKNIEDIGIALAKSQGTSDNNAGRVIFPLKNPSGQVIGFSARKFNEGGSDAKYVNSPETKIFHKGATLYNYDQAKLTCHHDGYVYVLEGFMDVYALEEVGITSAVAIMGTALTSEQISLLRRLNVEIRLCLDGDNAGQRAMMRIMQLFDAAKLNYRLVHVPNELKDPDEILRQDGKEKLKLFLNSLVDPFIFALDYYENTAPLGSLEERHKVINHFLPMLLNAKSSLEYNDYILKLAKATRYEKEALDAYVKQAKKRLKENDESNDVNFEDLEVKLKPKAIQRDLKRLDLAEQAVLTQMLNSKEAVLYYEKNIKYFYDEVYRTVANYISEYLSNYDDVDVSMIIDEVATDDHENKKEIIDTIVRLGTNLDCPPFNEKMMDDFKDVIESTRKRIYEKDLVKKALEGRSVEEKARIADDYLKKTFQK